MQDAIPAFFFVFDAESIGLHGEGFAVAGGIYTSGGAAQSEFCLACDPDEAAGTVGNFSWVQQNVPVLNHSHRVPKLVRDAFWAEWTAAKARYPGIIMAAECLWPVEARFVAHCIDDYPEVRNQDGPYPFHEIASYMSAAGMDPMAKYDRTPSEMPAHNPLADARQSARLLASAIAILKERACAVSSPAIRAAPAR